MSDHVKRNPLFFGETVAFATWAAENVDPRTAVERYSNIPGVSSGVADAYNIRHNTGAPLSERARQLAHHALNDVYEALAAVQFGGQHTSLDERLAFATHQGTVQTISDIANRSDGAKNIIIENHPGYPMSLKISEHNGPYLDIRKTGYTPLASSRKDAARCPYAKKHPDTLEIHPVMQKFVPWAGQVAVYIAERYRKV